MPRLCFTVTRHRQPRRSAQSSAHLVVRINTHRESRSGAPSPPLAIADSTYLEEAGVSIEPLALRANELAALGRTPSFVPSKILCWGWSARARAVVRALRTSTSRCSLVGRMLVADRREARHPARLRRAQAARNGATRGGDPRTRQTLVPLVDDNSSELGMTRRGDRLAKRKAPTHHGTRPERP